MKSTPIILANTEWIPPERLLNQVKAERMITALCDMAKPGVLDYKDFVGDAECVAYIMPHTGRVPLQGEWTKIYLYLCRRVIKKMGINLSEEDMTSIFETCDNLNEYEEEKLNNLKKWIYKVRGGNEKNIIINALKEVFTESKNLEAKK